MNFIHNLVIGLYDTLIGVFDLLVKMNFLFLLIVLAIPPIIICLGIPIVGANKVLKDLKVIFTKMNTAKKFMSVVFLVGSLLAIFTFYPYITDLSNDSEKSTRQREIDLDLNIIKREVNMRYRDKGMSGLMSLSSGCYDGLEKHLNSHNLKRCAVIDILSHMIDIQMATEYRIPRSEYFEILEIYTRARPYLEKGGISDDDVRGRVDKWVSDVENSFIN